MIEGPKSFDWDKEAELMTGGAERDEMEGRTVAQLEQQIILLKEQLAVLKERSETDQLTGLLNKSAFEKRMDTMIESLKGMRESDRAGKRISLLFIDVDKFKSINDERGHPAGDAVLRAIADVLKKHVVRESDCAARWAGDEFAIGLENAGDVAEKIAQEVRAAVEALEPPIGPVTVSIGLGETTGIRNVLQLYGRADEALYKAKGGGRNKVVVAGKLEEKKAA